MSDMVKVSETSPNFVKSKFHSVDLVPTPTSDLKLINVLKCQKMEEVAHTIVRHQPKVRDEYRIPENTSVCHCFLLLSFFFFHDVERGGIDRFWNSWKISSELPRRRTREPFGCGVRQCSMRSFLMPIFGKASKQLVSDAVLSINFVFPHSAIFFFFRGLFSDYVLFFSTRTVVCIRVLFVLTL